MAIDIAGLRTDALALCHAIEDLPASEQQTRVSLLASALHQRLESVDVGGETVPVGTTAKANIEDVRRCYDLYLWAFAKARSMGVVDVDVTPGEEKELGADLVLLHRRAILQGTIDGAEQDATDFNTTPPRRIPRPVGPCNPKALWEAIRPSDDEWDFLHGESAT